VFFDNWLTGRFSVLRLFFTEPLSRDTLFTVNLPGYSLAYDVNAKGAFSKSVIEDGQSFWMVELPIGYDTDVAFGHEIVRAANDNQFVSVGVRSPDCASGKVSGKACESLLIKIDADQMGRWSTELSAQWLAEFAMRGAVYTAHGGDRLSSFAPQNYMTQEWKNKKPTNTTLVGFDQPLAGEKSTKAYIGDLVETIGVRGIRPFTSNLGDRNVMANFPQRPLSAKEFLNTATLRTNWENSPKLSEGESFSEDLNLLPETIEELERFDNCSFAAASWLRGYVDASLRSTASNYLGGEIWYTHFASKCANTAGKQIGLGFDDVTKKAFNILSRRSHGLMSKDDIQFYPNRLWVLPPSGAFRSRILEEEINNYGLDIEISDTKIIIESRDSQFYDNEIFPRAALATRDLNGLTFEVAKEKLLDAEIRVDDVSIGSVVKTIEGEKAYMTVLDTTDAISISGVLNSAQALSPRGKTCHRPETTLRLTNISALGFSIDGTSLAQSGGDMAIEVLLKDKPGSLVFANNTMPFNDKFEARKNTVFKFAPNAATKLNGHSRYLVPTYDIDKVQGWKAEEFPTVLYGDVEKICLYSRGVGSAKLHDIRAYKYVTSNALPQDPLIIGGQVELLKTMDYKSLFVRITARSGERQYASVNEDGFYYGRLNNLEHNSKIDEALKDAWIDIELMQADPKTNDIIRLNGQKLHALNSTLNVDLAIGAAR